MHSDDEYKKVIHQRYRARQQPILATSAMWAKITQPVTRGRPRMIGVRAQSRGGSVGYLLEGGFLLVCCRLRLRRLFPLPLPSFILSSSLFSSLTSTHCAPFLRRDFVQFLSC